MLTSAGLFGFPLTEIEGLIANTGAFEFEIVKEGGFFAFLALLVFLTLIIFSLSRYSAKSKDSAFVKIIILSFLIATFLHSSFLWKTFPLIYEDDYYFSFFRSAPYLIALFLLGYAYYPIKGTPLVEAEQGAVIGEETGNTIQTLDDLTKEEEIKL